MPSAASQAVTVWMIGLVMTPPQSVITPRSGRSALPRGRARRPGASGGEKIRLSASWGCATTLMVNDAFLPGVGAGGRGGRGVRGGRAGAGQGGPRRGREMPRLAESGQGCEQGALGG